MRFHTRTLQLCTLALLATTAAWADPKLELSLPLWIEYPNNFSFVVPLRVTNVGDAPFTFQMSVIPSAGNFYFTGFGSGSVDEGPVDDGSSMPFYQDFFDEFYNVS